MLSLMQSLCPYPTVTRDGEYKDGLLLPQPRVCSKCERHDCWKQVVEVGNQPLAHFHCAKGVSLLLFRFPEGSILSNGIIVKEHNTACAPELRKQLQAQKISLPEAQRWHDAMFSVVPILQDQAGKNVVDAVNSLHDVTTGVSLVMRNAEAIIADLPGLNDDDRIENAPAALKSLLKSVQLLHRRLLMPSYVTNPESAAHGQKHPTPVYKVFHRMVRLFEQVASRGRVGLRMGGYSVAVPVCYDSFETIALVLLDNAIKYSLPNGTVLVNVNDTDRRTVHVAVESDGPIVPDDMTRAIFEPRIRARSAEDHASTGSGLGLYIAKVVADAHKIEIGYACTSRRTDGKTGRNVFSFNIPY